MKPDEVADFAGEWRLSRFIDDRKADTKLRLTGTALFEDEGQGDWLYSEEGQLEQPDHPPIKAERSYRFRDIPGGAIVRFADGMPFHMIHWSNPSATHLCDPDLYKVRYDFSGWPEWRAIWEVTGPRKNYTMTSDYWRT